ncbi:hypothetical protein [Aeromonas veronii]|uniref:hypothetical protein n=1 Tax=Aeromonas veronii TaxID=654 RepID=UPI0032EEF46A
MTQSLKTPLAIARILFYLALLMVAPLPMMMFSGLYGSVLGGAYVILFLLPIAMVLMLISSLMAILIAMVEAKNKSHPRGEW